MKLRTIWTEKMRFTTKSSTHEVPMDAKRPIGEDAALNPKELVLAGLSGCTAMDVVALLRKYRQTAETFEVEAETTLTDKYPAVFQKVSLRYIVKGNVEAPKLIEAVTLSQTKFCGVSAMIAKAAPIEYVVELNGEEIQRGNAHF
ncbi:MAG: OsmC family protein [Bdellovibrionales bacterium]|nr:OsmC family protein [Bdellovibrionales bacterium]